MITEGPRKSPHAKAAKRLREAIDAAALAESTADFIVSTCASYSEAIERLQAMQDAVAKAVTDLDYLVVCLYDNPRQAGRAQNTHDDLAALIDESERP